MIQSHQRKCDSVRFSKINLHVRNGSYVMCANFKLFYEIVQQANQFYEITMIFQYHQPEPE